MDLEGQREHSLLQGKGSEIQRASYESTERLTSMFTRAGLTSERMGGRGLVREFKRFCKRGGSSAGNQPREDSGIQREAKVGEKGMICFMPA